jgi:integrase
MADRRDATAAAAATLFNNDVLPAWGKRKAESIRRRDVMKLLDGMREEPAKAIKAKARLHHFFGWCVEREIINGSPVANVKTQHKAASRERALTDDELRRVWKACDKVGVIAGAMVRTLILTMARRNEVAQMLRAELSESLWSIDGSRTKNGRAVDVHRSAAFNSIIEGLPVSGPFVFTGRHRNKPIGGFSDLKARLDEAIGEGMAPWTFHDLRRTGSTMMQRLGIRPEVIDACQNHLPQGIKRVYQRHQYATEKRHAFEALAAEVSRIVAGKDEASNVVPLTRPVA